MKRIAAFILTLLCLMSVAYADGQNGSANYIYSYHSSPIAVPPAYTLKASITARDIPGLDTLDKLADAYVTDDKVYVLCASRLIVFTHDFEAEKILTTYVDETGKEVKLDGCTGVTVTPDGGIYITQSENGRILHFDKDGTLVRTLGRPEITGFENVKYRPTKLVVDSANRIYVISKGMYEGIVELNPDGSFSRFFGVNNVTFTPWQLLWRVFSTAEQRSRQVMWLPSDFTNLSIDQDGFLFATLFGSEEGSVKRLNAKGENIIKVPDDMPYPKGDEWTNQSGFGIPTGHSQFIAVDTNAYGVYLCLDGTRSRVFAYNEDHRLLFVFGGIGDREGYFRSPVDACFVGDDILVLDSLAQSLEVFSPTLYGSSLMSAVKHQYLYEYDTASEYWQEALSYNPHLTLAYSGIGRKLLREGEYDQALEYLKQGEDRTYYNKAYEKVRNRVMREYFAPVLISLAALIVLRIVIKAILKRRKKNDKPLKPKTGILYSIKNAAVWTLDTFWRFPMRIMMRPFKGFDAMKFEKRGSYIFAFFVLILSSMLSVMEYVYTGFLINYSDIYKINSLYLTLTVLFPVALFVLGNWCVTTLMNGKGKLMEIFMAGMYAMFPFCLTRILALLLTNVLTLDEMSVVFTIRSIGVVLFVFYLFIGQVMVHEYGFGRCLAALLLTIVAMMVLVFILMLIFALSADVVDFVTIVFKELRLKIT